MRSTAVGLSSDINIHLQQAPRNSANSPWNNISETALLYRQVSYTAYQYPFALSRSDCISKPEWTKALIKAIAELSEVAGGKGISYIQMCPRSIMARLTPCRVPGYDTYGFNEEGEFTELYRLIDNELPGEEFWLGGECEIIVNLDMMLGVQADSELISQVRKGLNGEGDRPRYGFPFAGDNNFLFDRIDCLDQPLPTHWFVRSDSNLELEPGAISLTVEIDRQNPSQTKSLLFSTTQNPSTSLPDSEWLSIFELSQ